MKKLILLSTACITTGLYNAQNQIKLFKTPEKINPTLINNQTSKVSSTYWVPTREWDYSWDVSNSQWQLTDTIVYSYYSTPANLNGALYIQKDYNFTNVPPTLYVDTNFYDNNANKIYATTTKATNFASPSYTPSFQYYHNFNSNNKNTSNITNQYRWSTCLMNYTFYPSNKDTSIYNSSNYLIFNKLWVNTSSCHWAVNWMFNQSQTYFRNSNNLITTEIDSICCPAKPSQKLYFYYNTQDTLNKVIMLSFNSSTSQYDTSTQFVNIKFLYYDKYNMEYAVVSSYNAEAYTTGGIFKPMYRAVNVYNSAGDLIKQYQLNWNNATNAYSDTTFVQVNYIYYASNGAKDSIVRYMKNGNNPYQPLSKTLYLSNHQVVNAVNTLSKDNFILVYPNPANNEVKIYCPNASADAKTITITDITGKTVMQSYHETKDIHLNIENLNSGIYFINMKDGSNIYTTKLIKN